MIKKLYKVILIYLMKIKGWNKCLEIVFSFKLLEFLEEICIKLNNLKESFNRNDVSNLKDKKYPIMDTCIKAQYELLLSEMTEMIEYEINKFYLWLVDKLMEKLPTS